MITTEQAIQMAREVGAVEMQPFDYGDQKDRFIVFHDQLTALCNLVRRKTLLEAAEYFGRAFDGEEIRCGRVMNELEWMAEGEWCKN